MQLIIYLGHLSQSLQHLQVFLQLLASLLDVREYSCHLWDIVGKHQTAIKHHEGGKDSLAIIGRTDVAQHSCSGHWDCEVKTVVVLAQPIVVLNAICDHPVYLGVCVGNGHIESAHDVIEEQIGWE